jgi:TRAP-type C4-dicarboxylate transport system substrate-binding protein
MELLLMFQNSVAGTKAMMALYKEGLLDKDYATVKALGLYVLEPYPIFTTDKKIETVRNFRGMRIRTPSITSVWRCPSSAPFRSAFPAK